MIHGGLAPKGWHVASDEEWTTLSTYLGGESVAGGKLKEPGTAHWNSPNEGATNEKGFSALPSGCRDYNGSFFLIGFSGYLLSSTEDGATSACAWGWCIGNAYTGLVRSDFDKGGGFAVRCVKDSKNTPPTINSITPISASIGAEIKLSGRSFGSTRGTSVVSFSGANVSEYKSWSDTEIKVKVPVGATSGKLSVTVNNQKSNEFYFTVSTTLADGVTIDTQVWMAKNLDVDHYRNGDPIPQVTDSTEWKNLTTGAWCYYNNDANNGATYGKIYNWYAVNDSRGLAPVGWHIPSDAEWTTLSTYLGGESVAGGKLKEIGTIHWHIPNTDATNESVFTALPGGFRYDYGTFYGIEFQGYWWSASEFGTANAWSRFLYYLYCEIHGGNCSKGHGFSVRCVKD